MDQAGEDLGKGPRLFDTVRLRERVRALVALLPRGHRLRRHGLRADAAGRAAGGGNLPHRAAPGSAADGGAGAARRLPPGSRGAVVPAPIQTASVDRQHATLVVRRRGARGLHATAVAAARGAVVARVRAREAETAAHLYDGLAGDAAALPGDLRLAALPQDRSVPRGRPRHRQRDLGEEDHASLLSPRRLRNPGRRTRSVGARAPGIPARRSTRRRC